GGHGGLGFLEAMDGPAYEELAVGESDGSIDRKALACQVDGVRANSERHVQPVVDRQLRAVLVRYAQKISRLREQGSGRGGLVAQLNPVDASIQRQRDRADQLLGAAARLGDEMELERWPGR